MVFHKCFLKGIRGVQLNVKLGNSFSMKHSIKYGILSMKKNKVTLIDIRYNKKNAFWIGTRLYIYNTPNSYI